MVFSVLCPVQACYCPGKQCWETSCLIQSCPVMYMASDQCRPGVLSVVSCSGQLYSWKPVLRDLPASVLSCRVYCCRSGVLHSWCSACCVLFRPVLFLETSVERHACCSSVLLCLWLLICAVRVFWVLCPAPTCWVTGNQCWETSCLLQSRPVVSMDPDLGFWVLCPVQAWFVPGNQCWETSCLLQSSPVLYMASDLCCRGVLSVLSCSDLLCSWKPVLQDILLASAVSCCVYVFWSVPSGILSVVWLLSCFCPVVFLGTSVERLVCFSPILLYVRLQICGSWYFAFRVLLRPVAFLETRVDRPPVCRSPVLLCLWILICAVMVFSMLCPVPACYVHGNLCWETPCLLQYHPVVSMASDLCHHGVLSVVSLSGLFFFLETSVERPPVCCSPVLLCLWLLICAVMVFWVLCPVQACYVPGNQCWETSCLLQSRPVVSMASDQIRHDVLSVVSCFGLTCSWKPVLRDLLSASV